jgi:hypothetical protein
VHSTHVSAAVMHATHVHAAHVCATHVTTGVTASAVAAPTAVAGERHARQERDGEAGNTEPS